MLARTCLKHKSVRPSKMTHGITSNSKSALGYLDDEQAFDVNEGPAEGRTGFSLFGTSAIFDGIVVYDEGGLAVDPADKLATLCRVNSHHWYCHNSHNLSSPSISGRLRLL